LYPYDELDKYWVFEFGTALEPARLNKDVPFLMKTLFPS
jgi:hypothetical protein